MNVPARFPKVGAWLVILVLLGVATLGALQGLRALEPSAPTHLEHVHGVITEMRGADDFAMRIPGHAGLEWFRVAPGAHISMAHLERHMHEQAPTDVYYQEQHGSLLAWLAD